jgi:hypothetical protein
VEVFLDGLLDKYHGRHSLKTFSEVMEDDSEDEDGYEVSPETLKEAGYNFKGLEDDLEPEQRPPQRQASKSLIILHQQELPP